MRYARPRASAALALALIATACAAHAQTTIVSVSGVNGQVNNGVILGPANGGAVVDIQFSLSQEFNNVSIVAPFMGNSSNSVADFYLTTQVGAGTTSANAVASNTGVALPYGSHYATATLFYGLDLKAGTYNLVLGGVSGTPYLGYTYPLPATASIAPNVTYGYLSTQNGATYEPASTLAPSTVAFNFEIRGDPVFLVGSAAGSSSYLLTTSGNWTATANNSWLHISAGSASGAGNAVVAYTYDANTGAETRTGALTIGSIPVTVTQAGSNYLKAGSVVTLVSSGLGVPQELATDGAGNVYIADCGNNAVKEWSASTQQVTTLVSSGLMGPLGVAVDGSGNVYIADRYHNAIKEWSAATQQVTSLVSSGLNGPSAVAVDGSGNLYIADYYNNAIKEWGAATQQVTTLVSSGLNGPTGVAVDDAGNVYIADTSNNAIKEWKPRRSR